MDKVIRISSQQGFADTWTNATTPKTLNLCDFTIPRGMNVDLSKSYIAFNAQITTDNANPTNSNMYLDTNNGDKYNVPVSALIKNCHISNDRGMVESVRRVDTLNCGLFGLLDNAEDRKNNLNTFACYTADRGEGNKTSYFLDAVTNNVSPDGLAIDATKISREIARDLKIPLNELFGVANSEAYSTDLMGETRIHLETNFQKMKAEVFGGAEGTTNGFDGATAWGKFQDINNIPNTDSAGGLQYPLKTTLKYDNWQLTFPFYVGQVILATATASGGTAVPAAQACIIKSIRYQNDNTATPPTGAQEVYMTVVREDDPTKALWENDSGGNANLTNITFNAKVDQTQTLQVNRADLVLATTDASPDQSITYETYLTEEDVAPAGITEFSKAYSIEGECAVWMAMFPNSGQILPNRSILSYRYAIDNVEQTGNRDIEVCTGDGQTAGQQPSPFQMDRLQRALDHQAGLGFRNSQLRFYKNSTTQALAYDAPVSVIAETAPAKPDNKILSLQVNSAGLEEIKLYKQVQRTI